MMKKENPFNLLLISKVVFFCILSIQAFAQTDSVDKDLTEMSLQDLFNVKITTVSKTSQKASQAPATVIVVTEEQIKMRGYRSLLDVMMDLPEYKVDDLMRSMMRNYITVRGIPGQEKFAILLDGVQISSPTNETQPIMENFPVNLAKQIEIVYGPASALYGADAMSGVINIISRKNTNNNITADASSLVGMYGLTNNTLFINKKISNDVNLVVSGQYYFDQRPDYSKLYKADSLWNMSSHQTGIFHTTFGPQQPLKPVSPNYDAPMTAYNIYAALHAKGFSFSFFKNYSQIPSSFENNPNNAVYNKDVFLGQNITVFSAGYTMKIGSVNSISTLRASEYGLNPLSNFRNLYTNMEAGYKYAYGSSYKAEQQFEWSSSSRLNLVAGVSFEQFHSSPKSTDLQNPVSEKRAIEGTFLNTQGYYRPEGLPAVFYDLRYGNTGGYVQLQYEPVVKKVWITAGGRYDYNSRYGTTLNPRVGVVWKIGEQTTVKALFGSAYIAPSPFFAYEYYGSFYSTDSAKTYKSFFWHLPNPNLKPITSYNEELSVQQFFGKHFNVEINGHYTYIKNLFAVAADADHGNLYNGKFLGYNVDYIEITINQNRQTLWGGCLKMNYSDKTGMLKWDVYGSLSYVDGTFHNGQAGIIGTPLDMETEFISHWITKAGIDLKAGKFSFSPRVIFMANQKISGIADTLNSRVERQTIKGYTLLNMTTRYQIGKLLNVFVSVSNALNQKYKSVGWDMDLKNKNTNLFYGAYQDPIRVSGGVNLMF